MYESRWSNRIIRLHMDYKFKQGYTNAVKNKQIGVFNYDRYENKYDKTWIKFQWKKNEQIFLSNPLILLFDECVSDE